MILVNRPEHWNIYCSDSSQMRFVDIFIIYLAAGAPVATYSIFHRSTESWFVKLTVFLRNLVFWPVVAATIVRSIIRNIPNTPHFVTRETSDSRITEYEEKLATELSVLKRMSPSVSFFKGLEEAVGRYVGLSSVVRPGGDHTAESAFFSITDHPQKKIAAICLNRRNLNRVIVHRKKAAQDIAQLLLVADISERSRVRFRNSLVPLAELYDDSVGASLFHGVSSTDNEAGIVGRVAEVEHCLDIEHKTRK